jgi:hypothetical protein
MSSPNTSGKNRKNITSKWQIKRMKMMIVERWEDVWDTVKLRENYRREFYFMHHID